MQFYGPSSLSLTYSVSKMLEQTPENLSRIEVLRKRGFSGAIAEEYGPEVQTFLIDHGATVPHLGAGDSGGGFFCRKTGDSAWSTVATIRGMDLIAERSYELGLKYYFVLAVGHKFKTFKENRVWDWQ
jgi:hypothetical protein